MRSKDYTNARERNRNLLRTLLGQILPLKKRELESCTQRQNYAHFFPMAGAIAVSILQALSPSTGFTQQSPSFGTREIELPVSIRSTADYTLTRSRDEQYAQIAQEVELLERQQSLLRRVVRLVAPTVIHIEAIKEEHPPATRGDSTPREPKRIEEAGSGVLVSIGSTTAILTNRHVIHGAPISTIRLVTSEGGLLAPVRVLEDPSTDVAVIEIENHTLPVARLADSRNIEIGDFVFAVGSPFGLNHSVSYGIISAKGRRNLELGSKAIVYQDFIQTDAAINPGNSGGPLMNMRGEVVGINTAIASNSGGNEGIGFAIPINLAMNVAQQLIDRGEMQHAYLGVSVERRSNLVSTAVSGGSPARGAFVKVIKPHSPAESAGLQYGDIIVEFDGTSVDDDEHLIQLVGLTDVNKRVDIAYIRNNQLVKINVQLMPKPNMR